MKPEEFRERDVVSGAGAEIELVNVTRQFAGALAVRDLSFSVASGEIVALVGRTGAGKSTAMNLIMGTLAPHAGTVRSTR